MLYRSARPESGWEARKRCLMAPLGRTQSEPHRRLALAGGFRLSELSLCEACDRSVLRSMSHEGGQYSRACA